MYWAVIRLSPLRPHSIAKIWAFNTRKQAEKFAETKKGRFKSFYHVVNMFVPGK